MDELTRLKIEYEHRKQRLAKSDVYSLFNRANLFIIQQRQREVLSTLKKNGISDFSDLVILEMGCGGGSVLAEYLGFGAPPENLFGVDVLFDRLVRAKHALPASGLSNADGQHLPYSSKTFDLVLQFTAVSSILDPMFRCSICAELLRVLKTSGTILWYDFWLNPTNRQTRGIRPQEIRQLFPNCTYEFHRITLAPPIARRIVPTSWMLALLLEKIKLINSHYLAVIRPK